MRKIALMITAVLAMVGAVFAATPAYAATEGTAILDSCWNPDDQDGEGIKCILKITVDILTVGVGVLGVLGIVIAGIQYLTSAGNEEQMRKAKRRIFEIVIGLAAYVLIYALLSWLLPGFQGI